MQSGEKTNNEILDPIEKLDMPLTQIYGKMEAILDCFLCFAKEMS